MDQGLREVTSQTTLQIMYDVAFPTTDETAVQTTPQTIRSVIPQAGVSFASYKPKASSHEQITQESGPASCSLRSIQACPVSNLRSGVWGPEFECAPNWSQQSGIWNEKVRPQPRPGCRPSRPLLRTANCGLETRGSAALRVKWEGGCLRPIWSDLASGIACCVTGTSRADRSRLHPVIFSYGISETGLTDSLPSPKMQMTTMARMA